MAAGTGEATGQLAIWTCNKATETMANDPETDVSGEENHGESQDSNGTYSCACLGN
jgi:hypothetical protein